MSLIAALLLAALLGLVLVVWGLYLLFRKPSLKPGGFYVDYPQAQVRIGGGKGPEFSAAVAATIPRREQGLSGCPRLAPDQGMLFTYPVPARYTFWMKGMNFPLDIVWIRHGRMIGVLRDVPAPGAGTSIMALPRYKPPVPIDSALEVNAGVAAEHGWEEGDEVKVVITGG